MTGAPWYFWPLVIAAAINLLAGAVGVYRRLRRGPRRPWQPTRCYGCGGGLESVATPAGPELWCPRCERPFYPRPSVAITFPEEHTP